MGLFDIFKRRKKTVKKKRGFDAADINRFVYMWLQELRNINEDLKAGLPRLKARARDLFQNNDYVRKYIKLVSTNVVGHQGILLQMKVVDQNGKPDKVANDLIEKAWRKWTKRGECDVTGLYSWVDLQRIFIETVARDGEVFVRFVPGYSNSFKFAIQVLEADIIDVDYNQQFDNGNKVIMGVEVNKWNKPVAYWIKEDKQSGRKRISADEAFLAFIPERPGQVRGYPWFTTAILDLKHLDAYEEAELIAARIAASKMGFYVTESGDEFTETEEKQALVREVEPGIFEELPAGVKLEMFDPKHPPTTFAEFIKAKLRTIAAGMNVSYHSLSGDLESVNYSSIRAGSLEERETWKSVQAWMINTFCQPVFERWLKHCLNFGLINLPAGKFDKFNAPSWHPRRWDWVDPLKDVQASILALNTGLVSRTELAANRGRDLEELLEEIENEKKLLAEKGLYFSTETK